MLNYIIIYLIMEFQLVKVRKNVHICLKKRNRLSFSFARVYGCVLSFSCKERSRMKSYDWESL